MNQTSRWPISLNTKPMIGSDSYNKNKKNGLTYTHPTLETQAHKSHITKNPIATKPRKKSPHQDSPFSRYPQVHHHIAFYFPTPGFSFFQVSTGTLPYKYTPPPPHLSKNMDIFGRKKSKNSGKIPRKIWKISISSIYETHHK